MDDTKNPDKPERDEQGRMLPGHVGRGGRRRKTLTEDVENFLFDALNIKGARMLVECMTSATKLCGAEGVEHPDWAVRVHTFEVIRDTVVGKPAQAITNEDGTPLFSGGGEVLDALKRMATPKDEMK